ncbi:MFS transporter [Streptomyces sp. NPDC058773]|uniref:MFS transporter n=1 Tax=Streptomyces sp. NPDC058773 TaxID=3346632 RepID=UPI0036B1D4A1
MPIQTSPRPAPEPSPDPSESQMSAQPPSMSRWERRRVVLGTGIGNALEWYDWHIYGIFAPFFAKQFFDPHDELSALLSTLAIFAVGFLMRPVGGFLFGWLADRKGRRFSMLTSIGLAAAGSLAIGVAPTYTSIGVGASVFLLLARLTQGLAHGGELPSAQTYLAEAAPPARRGRWTSAIYVSGACGILLATLLGAGLAAAYGAHGVAAWGWRVPFVVGGLLGLYALFLRRRLTETHAFTKEHAADATGRRPSVLRGIWQNRGAAARVIGLTVGVTVVYQSWTVAAPAYAIGVQGLDATAVLAAEVVAIVVFIAVLPLCGALSDRIGRRPNMLVFGLGMAVLSYPLSHLARAGAVWQLGLAMTIALVLIALSVSILPALFAELFPTRVRATGTGVPYAIAVALCGGTAPYLTTWLSGHHVPGYFTGYAIALLLLGVLVVLTTPETRGKPLD